MATIGLILVVAPDRDFRRSLEFALEAELYAVDSHARLTTAVESPLLARAACAVVDEKAVRDHAYQWDALDRLGKPVILLVDRFRPPLSRASLTIMAKPLLGNALIERVGSITGEPGVH
ncbi:hypothetical protein [Aurantimonas marianensis]|uniref:Uncharacterized protein n=1 Tax=Aurantimonas marianensis TaxID=2920428 RepID=A0A9X2HAP7_9HYPH|nr:hypothetical protein [Aurantimonas marianensis]MCP3056893.1 hypothetical protein [Aurantimonas marianensis]